MAIISANRFSKMNGNYVIAANESYGVGDIGRILIENDRNDMAIFNAALKSDMYELQCRTEGTLLESEIQSLSENAIQDFFKSIIEKLKKFWAKAKGVFKKAYAMITAYVVRNGKAFVAANKKAIANLKDSTQLKGEVWVTKDSIDKVSGDFGKVDVDYAKRVAMQNKDSSASEIAKACLKEFFPNYDGDTNLYKWLKEACFEKKSGATLADCGGRNSLVAMLENGMKPIKEMKKQEREMEKAIKTSLKELETAARNAAKNTKDDETAKDAHTKEANAYKAASTGVTNAMSATMRATIRLYKFQLSNARIALAKAIGVQATTESTLLESMMLEAAEDLEDVEDEVDSADLGDSGASDVLTPEEAEAAAEILEKAADELCDGECEHEGEDD